MQYMGGKSLISKQIAGIINEVQRREVENRKGDCTDNIQELPIRGGGTFVSLFCGSCAVEAKVTGFDRMILNDKHEYLITMLKAVQNGYELPDNITEEQYKEIKANKDRDKALSGFVGFACSFGGKWFDCYARTNREERNYADTGKRSLLRDMATLMDAEFVCGDYRDVEIPKGSVVYADPPYRGTTGYLHEKFDSDAFFEYMRKVAQNGNKVFISEMSAPPDFTCIWEREVRRTIKADDNRQKATERLYTL